MIRITNQYFWNIVFSLFFLVLVAMGAIILEGEARIAYTDLSVTDFVLVTLATFRLTRLFVYDGITKFFREQFYDAKKTKTGIVLEKPTGGPRRTLADLLSCPWCIGIWMSATVTFFYLWTPYAIFPTILLAIAALSTTLQLLANLIGWHAEQAKNSAESI